jgi:glycosyltransferase involved in cell wall biosynthesis
MMEEQEPNLLAPFPKREGGARALSSFPLRDGGRGVRSPFVSVVMAAKNYGRFLAEAVESVLAQTFSDWELLIIDDGSSDDTTRVAAQFADSRIRYVKSDRLGQSRAKNLGIDLARGEFIAFLDADDAWLPTKLEKQLRLFTHSTLRGEGRGKGSTACVGVVFSRRTLMDESSLPLPPKPKADFPRGRVLAQMFSQNFVCFSSAMVRREVFARVGRFDPQHDLAIDYDLWLRVARHYGFEFVDEELVRYRTGHGNLSKKLADRVDGVLTIMHRNREGIADDVQAEGYASTYRTIGHVMRGAEPDVSLKWYWKALRVPHGRLISAKGLAGTLASMLRRKRVAGSAENASVNR